MAVGKLMQQLIELMKAPPVTPVTTTVGAVPTVGAADETIRDQESKDARLRKKGRAAYILTGDQGAGTPNTAAKTLTGE